MSNLRLFQRLQCLILDNNELISSQHFTPIPTLHTLWVNNNQVSSRTIRPLTLSRSLDD